jgi:immune inhibitor A
MPRIISLLTVLALMGLSGLHETWAVPAKPGWLDGEAQGRAFRFQLRGDEFCHWAVDEAGASLLQDSLGHWRTARRSPEGSLIPGALYLPGAPPPAEALGLTPDPDWLRDHVGGLRARRDSRPAGQRERVEGTWDLCVLLIRYPDQTPQVVPGNFDAMMNQPGWHGTGSFDDFYQSLSHGRFGTNSEVFGWYTAEHPHDYYGYNQGWERAQQLVREAVLAADPVVDFSRYDNDGNGVVDALLVVHTGQGAEEGNDNNIWSHRWALWGQEMELDGVTISDYTMQPELQGQSQSAIGVYVHEFGHALGLPDLYDTDYSSSGVGTWCVMSGGSWGGGAGGNAHVPVSFSAFCRDQLGWTTTRTVDVELLDHPLPALHLSDEIIRLNLPGHPQQYFLVENRRLAAWDIHQPAEGLHVWHVDEAQWSNENEERFLVDLEQADGMRHLNQGMGADGADLFPGSTGNRHFDAFSQPSSMPYGGLGSPVIITAIGDPADSLRASFFQLFTHQDLVVRGLEVVDDDDGDGVAEAGETVQLRVTLENRGAAVDSLWLYLESVPGATALEPGLAQGPVAADGIFQTGLLGLALDAGLPTGRLALQLGSRDPSGWQSGASFDLQVGRGSLLLVLDGAEPALGSWYETALAASGHTVEIRTTQADLPPVDLDSYGRVIWATARDNSPLVQEEIAALATYVDAGGHLLLSGQHLLENLDEAGRTFLGADPGPTWASMPRVKGLTSGGLLEDDESLLLVGAAGAWNQQLPTVTLLPRPDAVPTGRWSTSSHVSMLRRTPGLGRLLVAGYSLESVHAGAGLVTLEDFLRRALLWLDEGLETGVEAGHAGIRPRTARLAAAPNPFNPATVLELEVTRRETLTLAVWNLAGQRVLERSLGTLPAGTHRVPLDLSGQASGVYLAALHGAEGTRAGARLLLLK